MGEIAPVPMTPVPAAAPNAPAALLFVDDEPNILNAIKRVFRGRTEYRVFTAGSGAEALRVLEQEAVGVVISDMRMPEMDGAKFLEQVRTRWPDTVRLLLTGYADVTSTVSALNQGGIYHYIAKPWDDDDLLLVIRRATDLWRLQEEKRRLEALTLVQNEELKKLNGGLEEIVRSRTDELQRAMAELRHAHETMKQGFLGTVQLLSGMIETRHHATAGHSRRVAEYARAVAQRMELTDTEIQDVVLAALLHDFGKIGLPDALFDKPYTQLSRDERVEVDKHPIKGEMALMALAQLHNAAKLIRHHHERFDGSGYPDHLVGLAIPLGARVLAVVNDYDAMVSGTFQSRALPSREAFAYILEQRGRRYDPAVIAVFLGPVRALLEGTAMQTEQRVATEQLQPGRRLSRDVVDSNGLLLLSKGYVLDDKVIRQFRAYERAEGKPLAIWVHP